MLCLLFYNSTAVITEQGKDIPQTQTNGLRFPGFQVLLLIKEKSHLNV